MIWENKVQSIVMLTNLTENSFGQVCVDRKKREKSVLFVLFQRKCDQYWPEVNQTVLYGSFRITGLSHQCLTDYDKRLFALVQVS